MTPPIICDWLDVTFSPDCAPWPGVNSILLDAGFDAESSDRSTFVYRLDGATVIFGPSRGSLRASFSGSACAALRRLGVWSDLLSELASAPHRVTRVDAALDLSIDGADMVDLMRKRYPPAPSISVARPPLPRSFSPSVLMAARLALGTSGASPKPATLPASTTRLGKLSRSAAKSSRLVPASRSPPRAAIQALHYATQRNPLPCSGIWPRRPFSTLLRALPCGLQTVT